MEECAYCEQAITGEFVHFGNRYLHPKCHQELQHEMDATWGEPAQEPATQNDLDWSKSPF